MSNQTLPCALRWIGSTAGVVVLGVLIAWAAALLPMGRVDERPTAMAQSNEPSVSVPASFVEDPTTVRNLRAGIVPLSNDPSSLPHFALTGSIGFSTSQVPGTFTMHPFADRRSDHGVADVPSSVRTLWENQQNDRGRQTSRATAKRACSTTAGQIRPLPSRK